MAFAHGKKQIFSLDSSAGSLVALTAYITDNALTKAIDLAETSVLGVNSKTFVVGLEDNKFSLSGKFDPTLDAHMANLIAALKNGTLATASIEYGPQGSTSGLPKYTGESLVTSYEISGGVGDALTWSAELQVTGDITRTTY